MNESDLNIPGAGVFSIAEDDENNENYVVKNKKVDNFLKLSYNEKEQEEDEIDENYKQEM